jgi:DNA-binding response OmpR family regulator
MTLATEDNSPYRPCLILAHADPTFADLTCRSFRRRGWDVYRAHTGPEIRRLARMMGPDLVLLDTDLPGESGWLTCDKLTREQPHARVILVGPSTTPQDDQLAAFVGASALVNRADGMTLLVHEVCGTPLPAAG